MSSVCIDGFNISLPRGSGIATYGRNLLVNARAIGLDTQVLYGPPARIGSDPLLNAVAVTMPSGKPFKVHKSERFLRTALSRYGRTARAVAPATEIAWPQDGGRPPAADRFWAAQDLFHYALRGYRKYGGATPVRFDTASAPAPDVMHWTAVLPMHAKGVANIHTFHDLIPLRLPHTTVDDKAAFLTVCRQIARHTDHIAVVSETTRRDVIQMLDVPEDRVTNTYQAVELPPHLVTRPQDEVQRELETAFGLGWKDYFLHFGAIEPKKNLGRIVEAYLASDVKTPLAIVGGRAWLDAGETAMLDQVEALDLPVGKRIRRFEYASFSHLISLIRGAKAVLFPSLYEGFGLPVLEAMALDTAVLTSTAGSLPEVSGDATISVDPYDVQAMSRGIQALDADEALRDDLVRRGRIQAAKFTPEAYQSRLRELYAKVGVR